MAAHKFGYGTASAFTEEGEWSFAPGEPQALRRKFDLYSGFAHETAGGRARSLFISDEVYRILEPGLTAVRTISDHNISEQALGLISDIAALVVNLHNSWNADVSRLPALHAVVLDDGSFLVEWLFSRYRIGFVLEENRQESIWYLVSTMEATSVERFGQLSEADNTKLVAELVSFVFDHS